jgi:hypothetical protein
LIEENFQHQKPKYGAEVPSSPVEISAFWSDPVKEFDITFGVIVETATAEPPSVWDGCAVVDNWRIKLVELF